MTASVTYLPKNAIGKKVISTLDRAGIEMILLNQGNQNWCVGALVTDPTEALKLGMMLGNPDAYGEVRTDSRLDSSLNSVPHCIVFIDAKAKIALN